MKALRGIFGYPRGHLFSPSTHHNGNLLESTDGIMEIFFPVCVSVSVEDELLNMEGYETQLSGLFRAPSEHLSLSRPQQAAFNAVL